MAILLILSLLSSSFPISPVAAQISRNSDKPLPKIATIPTFETEQLAPTFDNTIEYSSAFVRKKPVIKKLAKKHFRSDEEIQIAVSNIQTEPFKVEVFDAEGKVADVDVEQQKSIDQVIIDVEPQTQFRPGKYNVVITDKEGNRVMQDFEWGVLAINADRSIYQPNQNANLSMAVLDDKGNMVCDSKLELKIKHQTSGKEDVLSTANSKITVNPECTSHDFTLKPDYQATYKLGEEGTYTMTLTAGTGNGSYTITDQLFVQKNIPFYIERVSATRIYPPNNYPVNLTITANQDFEGTITETVPESFTILPTEGGAYTAMQTLYLEKEKDPAQSITSTVLGASTSAETSNATLHSQFPTLNSKLLLPFAGAYAISQGFGTINTADLLSNFYQSYRLSGHDGVDFAIPENTPIFAVDDGNVIWADDGDYGITVIIQHAWGKSYYGHLNKAIIGKDTSITKGTQIGVSGNTGESTGPHLHFGIKPQEPDLGNGYFGKIDPLPYFNLPSTATFASNTGVIVTESNVLGASSSGALEQPSFSVLENQMKKAVLSNPTTAGNEKVKMLQWKVKLKKGETTKLSYQFKAPDVSPQFYLLGPLRFYANDTDKPLFEEKRQWQIAGDAVSSEWYNDGTQYGGYSWQFRKQLTIDRTKVGTSSAWCNDASGVTCDTNWTSRMKLVFNNAASAENLTNFPVLVKLNSSRIDYSQTQNSGQDIRFVDPSDNTTVLSHEIESWNEDGDSYVWVNIPKIDAASTTDFVWLYYNNANASDGQAVNSTWNSNYVAVQHLEETSACPVSFTDSTSNGNNGTCGNSGPTADSNGMINGARDFESSSTQYIDVADQASQDLTNATLETWVKRESLTGYQFLIEKGQSDADNYSFFINDGTNDLQWWSQDANGNHNLDSSGTLSSAGVWYHVAVVMNSTADTISFYINGAIDAGSPQSVNLAPTAETGTLHFGIEAFPNLDAAPFDGVLDEIRISNAVRSTDWIEASYLTQTDAMITYGGNQTLTNFPVLVNLTTDPNLAANAQSTGNDILFTDNNGNKLDHQIENYTSSTGELVAWVEIPSVSAVEDTTFYMYYGNASASDQQNAAGTWDANYHIIYHMNETSGTTLVDSAGTAVNATKFSSTAPSAFAAGKIGGAQDFNGTSAYVQTNTPNLPTGDFSYEVWVNLDATNDETIFESLEGTATNEIRFYMANNLQFSVDNTDGTNTPGPATGNWYQFTFVRSGSTTTTYRNGTALPITISDGSTLNFNGCALLLGVDSDNICTGNLGNYMDGRMDEFRISNIARSIDWVVTTYTTANDPSSFYSLGTEENKNYAATPDKTMRHGQFFNSSGVIQPFVF